MFLLALALLMAGDWSSFDTDVARVGSRARAEARAAVGQTAVCDAAGQGIETHLLARALVALETSQRALVEQWTEDILVTVTPVLGLDPPGLSLGPAQIGYPLFLEMRPSDGAESYYRTVRENCLALAFVEDWIAATITIAVEFFDIAAVERIGDAYSGNRVNGRIDGALSRLVYNETLYALYTQLSESRIYDEAHRLPAAL